MESTLKTAYSVLPTLNRDELRQLQRRITEMLQEQGDVSEDLFPALSVDMLEKELDSAISEYDAGKGFSADAMCLSIRERFGWKQP